MDLIKNVGSKLDEKIKSGEIKESELIEEASDLLKNMKDMPGMGNIQSMLGKMGGGGMPNMGGKNSKINVGAMQAQMQQNLRKAKMRERLQAKQKKTEDTNQQMHPDEQKETQNKEPIKEYVFSKGEKVERSMRNTGPVNNKKNKKKKKKNKKKK